MSAGDAVGVVLAGGRSRRMGRDKTSLPLPFGRGETLLQWAASRMAAVCDDWLVADAGRGLLPGARSVADGSGRGPAAGLLGAALAFPGRPLLALACDLPLVPAAYLAHIRRSKGDWSVPVTAQGPEPLCALYRPAALEALERRVLAGRFSLRDLDSENPILVVRRIKSEELWRNAWTGHPAAEALDPDLYFANVNRPEDLRRATAPMSDAVSRPGSAALRQPDFLRLQ